MQKLLHGGQSQKCAGTEANTRALSAQRERSRRSPSIAHHKPDCPENLSPRGGGRGPGRDPVQTHRDHAELPCSAFLKHRCALLHPQEMLPARGSPSRSPSHLTQSAGWLMSRSEQGKARLLRPGSKPPTQRGRTPAREQPAMGHPTTIIVGGTRKWKTPN